MLKCFRQNCRVFLFDHSRGLPLAGRSFSPAAPCRAPIRNVHAVTRSEWSWVTRMRPPASNCIIRAAIHNREASKLARRWARYHKVVRTRMREPLIRPSVHCSPSRCVCASLTPGRCIALLDIIEVTLAIFHPDVTIPRAPRYLAYHSRARRSNVREDIWSCKSKDIWIREDPWSTLSVPVEPNTTINSRQFRLGYRERRQRKDRGGVSEGKVQRKQEKYRPDNAVVSRPTLWTLESAGALSVRESSGTKINLYRGLSAAADHVCGYHIIYPPAVVDRALAAQRPRGMYVTCTTFG